MTARRIAIIGMSITLIVGCVEELQCDPPQERVCTALVAGKVIGRTCKCEDRK